MDKLSDLYQEAKKNKFNSLLLLVEFLVFEKQVLHMTDSVEKLEHYMQPKFEAKMNEHLRQFKEGKN
jgi:hypothetical protein